MQKIELNKVDQELYYDVISNGLSVYMVVNKNVKDFHISFTTKYGGIHTEFKINDKYYKVSDGIAHFLEHVNFNYNDEVTAHDLFKELGSNINAYTTYDHTSYWVSSNNNLKKNLNLLLDYVQKGYFTEKNIAKEKGIIVEEIRRANNDVDRKSFYATNESLYVKDKRRLTVLGEEKDVNGITLEEVKLVHDNFYRPDNMFVVVTGNFNPEEVINIIEENQKNKQFNTNKVEIIKEKEPVEVNKKLIEIKDKQVEIPRIILNYKFDIHKFENLDLELLEDVLNIIFDSNIGYTSDLREKMDKEDLVSSMFYNIELLEDVIIVSIYMQSNNREKATEIVRDKMKNLQVSLEELERKRRVSIANLIHGYDFIRRVNSDIVFSVVKYNRVNANLFDLYNSVCLEDVKKVISLLDFSNESLVILEK